MDHQQLKELTNNIYSLMGSNKSLERAIERSETDTAEMVRAAEIFSDASRSLDLLFTKVERLMDVLWVRQQQWQDTMVRGMDQSKESIEYAEKMMSQIEDQGSTANEGDLLGLTDPEGRKSYKAARRIDESVFGDPENEESSK